MHTPIANREAVDALLHRRHGLQGVTVLGPWVDTAARPHNHR